MKKKLTVWNVLSLLILSAFALFVMYPLFLILYKSGINGDTGAFTIDNFAHFFAKKFYWGTMINSLKVTVVSTVLSAVVGLPLAYQHRCPEIGKDTHKDQHGTCKKCWHHKGHDDFPYPSHTAAPETFRRFIE